MTKLIFLDVDGVLNNQIHYRSDYFQKNRDHEDHDFFQFDPECVGSLNYITDKTGAKIVVSSSWRKGRTVEELKDLFKRVGITGEVIDKTPILGFKVYSGEEYHYSVPRGCEIKAWMEMNKDILGTKMSKARYIILDDDSDMLFWQRNNYIWVDSHCGITPNLTQKAINLLNS